MLLRWCACHSAWFWGSFQWCKAFFKGSVLDFGGWCGVWCWWGLVRILPSGPNGLGCLAFCLYDFWCPYVEALGGSELEFLHLQVVLSKFLAWAITRMRFLYIFCSFILSYVFCKLISGVDFYQPSFQKAILWADFVLLSPTVLFIFDNK